MSHKQQNIYLNIRMKIVHPQIRKRARLNDPHNEEEIELQEVGQDNTHITPTHTGIHETYGGDKSFINYGTFTVDNNSPLKDETITLFDILEAKLWKCNDLGEEDITQIKEANKSDSLIQQCMGFSYDIFPENLIVKSSDGASRFRDLWDHIFYTYNKDKNHSQVEAYKKWYQVYKSRSRNTGLINSTALFLRR